MDDIHFRLIHLVPFHYVAFAEIGYGHDPGGLPGIAREVAAIEPTVRPREVLRVVFEVEIVHHSDLWHSGRMAEVAVRRKEQVCFLLTEHARQNQVEPDAIEHWMTSGWTDRDRFHIRTVDELRIPWAVENENEPNDLH